MQRDCGELGLGSCNETPPDARWSVFHFILPSQVHMHAEHTVLVASISLGLTSMHWHARLNSAADLSRTKRSQRPAQIPATGHAMKKRRTAQRAAKTGLPEDMVVVLLICY